MNKTTPRQIKLKLLNSSDKRLLKSATEKRYVQRHILKDDNKFLAGGSVREKTVR